MREGRREKGKEREREEMRKGDEKGNETTRRMRKGRDGRGCGNGRRGAAEGARGRFEEGERSRGTSTTWTDGISSKYINRRAARSIEERRRTLPSQRLLSRCVSVGHLGRLPFQMRTRTRPRLAPTPAPRSSMATPRWRSSRPVFLRVV